MVGWKGFGYGLRLCGRDLAAGGAGRGYHRWNVVWQGDTATE